VGNDSGAIVLGWMTKLAATFALLGLVGFDGIAVVTATFSTADRANSYASEAADTFRATKDVDKAYTQVAAEAEAKGDTIDPKSFSVTPAGVVHLKVTHTADTLWVYRVSFLKKYATVSESGEGSGGL
jgi:hypothetical protein